MKTTKLAVSALLLFLVSVLAFPAIAAACNPGDTVCKPGTGGTIELTGTIRDFDDSNHSDGYLAHPDFGVVPEGGFHMQTGLVKTTLDADGKPVFSGNYGKKGAIQSQDSFYQWYRDVDKVNSSIAYTMTFTETTTGSGIYEFHTPIAGSFFPIDGFTSSKVYQLDTGWDGKKHNFLFTLELHTNIIYHQSTNQVFKFCSDDDMWVFVNGQLMVDLGGIHPYWNPEDTKIIYADTVASTLGLIDGQTYKMDVFFAERHVMHSQLNACGPIMPVPELPTVILFGLGIVVLGGFVWKSKRRSPKETTA